MARSSRPETNLALAVCIWIERLGILFTKPIMNAIRPCLPVLFHLCLSALWTPFALQAKPLNVLILYADDLGYGDLRVNNPASKIPTPHLNQLAQEGLRFTDGHSSSGICTPSRYALLTGRHHWRDFYGIVGVFGQSVFKPERLTLPEMMQQHDYVTACLGKWHLGWNWEAIKKTDAKPGKEGNRPMWTPDAFDWTQEIPDGPLDHGFDYYFGDTVINFPPYAWIENNKVTQIPDTVRDTSQWKKIKEGNWECRPGPMVTGWDPYQNIPTITQKGVDFIKQQKHSAKPFFLYFAFPSPHAPIIPNDEFDGKSEAGPYGDFVYETDHAAGQLIAALKETGQYDETIIFFSADNGPEHYAYARDATYDHWSSAPFRGLKRDIYEGGHHVPFILKWPGLTEPRTTSQALVSQIDIMATLAAMVGHSLPDDAAEDSHNLLPLLQGNVERIRDSHVHNTRMNQFAIRHEDWLLINAEQGYMSRRNKAWESKHNYPADDAQATELYNLADDPGQRTNLANEHPATVEKLLTILATIREQGYSAPRLTDRQ